MAHVRIVLADRAQIPCHVVARIRPDGPMALHGSGVCAIERDMAGSRVGTAALGRAAAGHYILLTAYYLLLTM